MKRAIVFLTLFFQVFNFAYAFKSINNKRNPINTDSVKKVLDLALNNNLTTKGMSYMRAFDIYNDTLYLINKNRFVKVFLKTGSVSTNSKINEFLAAKLKQHFGIERIIAQKEGYYLSCFSKIYYITNTGNVTEVHDNINLINDLNIINDKIFIAGRTNVIKVISKTGRVLSKISFDLVDAGYIRTKTGLMYYPSEQEPVYEFNIIKNAAVNTVKFSPITGVPGFVEPYISFGDEKYLLVFNYWDRSKIYIIKKSKTKGELYKRINLGGSFTESKSILQREEGEPNFKVDYYNGEYYIIGLVKGQLKIRSFKL
jgi:hypothetical protein